MNELKEKYINDVTIKIFKDDNCMRKFMQKEINTVIEIRPDILIAFDKPTIKKRFPFSFDEHVQGSHESAIKKCDIQKDFFFKANLQPLRDKIENCKKYKVLLYHQYFKDKTSFAYGYMACDDRKIYEFEHDNKLQDFIILTDAEKPLIINQLEFELQAFTKRLNTYWNKYGSTKLKSWTYSCWD